MNRNGRCAMGIDDFAQVAGMNWWELWPEAAQPLIRDAIAKAHDGENSRFEAFCPTAKGDPRWWDVSVAPLRDEAGTLMGLISVSRDISGDIVARELRESTAAEMRHRLQNAYALTSAIVLTTARGNPEREAFAREIVERLERLGIAQSLLLDGDTIGTTDRRCADPPPDRAVLRRRRDARHRPAPRRRARRAPGAHVGADARRVQHQFEQIWRARPWRTDQRSMAS